jgi:hypothetical protein
LSAARSEPRGLRRRTVVLIAVVVVLVVAEVMFSIRGRSPATPSPAGAVASVAAPKGSAPKPPSPEGRLAAAAHDQAGAIAEAQWIVSMEPALVASDDATAAQLVSSWAATSATASLTELVRQKRAGFVGAVGGPYSFDVAALAVKNAAADADDVTVELWCAEVVWAKGKPAYGLYVTQTLRMVWEGDMWRLASSVDDPGPAVPLAPGNAPTAIEDAASRLAGFGPVGLAENGS